MNPQQPQPTEALQQQLAQAMAELEQLKNPKPPTIEDLPPEEAMTVMAQDPVGFIRQLIDQAANTHLGRMREEAELRGALHVARKSNPDFARFEPFIVQEVAELIKTDKDGVIDPWDKLFEKGIARFQEKFTGVLKHNPQMLEAAAAEEAAKKQTGGAHVEGGAPRKLPELPPAFTRAQIGRMSTEEFLRNEAAIADAMKHGRIR